MAKPVTFDAPTSLPAERYEDSWDSLWADEGQQNMQVDAAPLPGRYFDYTPLINSGFDYGAVAGSASTSSRGSTP